MNAVLTQVLKRKREAGQELSLEDIKKVLKDINSDYTLALAQFNRLIAENPNHFYCDPARRPDPREPENPHPAVTANPAEIQQLAQARQENAVLTQALKESQDKIKKIQRDYDNQTLICENSQAKIKTLRSGFNRMREQFELEKQKNETLSLHISQQRQQQQQHLQILLQRQQQQTRDSVSDAPASADSHRKRQGGSDVPEAAKLPRVASKPVAIVAPLNAGESPRTGAVSPLTGALTVLPSLQDREIDEMQTLLRSDIQDKLILYWAELMRAYNSAQPEFTGSSLAIPDIIIQVIATGPRDTQGKYEEAAQQMLIRKKMTYGDFERVLRKLPQFTSEVNINEVIEALNSIPS